MTMTHGERKAYGRGYNRAISRGIDRVQVIASIARGYRDRLTDINSKRRCDACSRWTRGGANCIWGTCAADFDHGTEPRMWAEAYVGEKHADRAVITTEDFGCVNWLPQLTTKKVSA